MVYQLILRQGKGEYDKKEKKVETSIEAQDKKRNLRNKKSILIPYQ